eukprot:scaffold37904_cov23-Tisochrysis_lutea.AAC.1
MDDGAEQHHSWQLTSKSAAKAPLTALISLYATTLTSPSPWVEEPTGAQTRRCHVRLRGLG